MKPMPITFLDDGILIGINDAIYDAVGEEMFVQVLLRDVDASGVNSVKQMVFQEFYEYARIAKALEPPDRGMHGRN